MSTVVKSAVDAILGGVTDYVRAHPELAHVTEYLANRPRAYRSLLVERLLRGWLPVEVDTPAGWLRTPHPIYAAYWERRDVDATVGVLYEDARYMIIVQHANGGRRERIPQRDAEDAARVVTSAMRRLAVS